VYDSILIARRSFLESWNPDIDVLEMAPPTRKLYSRLSGVQTRWIPSFIADSDRRLYSAARSPQAKLRQPTLLGIEHSIANQGFSANSYVAALNTTLFASTLWPLVPPAAAFSKPKHRYLKSLASHLVDISRTHYRSGHLVVVGAGLAGDLLAILKSDLTPADAIDYKQYSSDHALRTMNWRLYMGEELRASPPPSRIG
jgi:hypothetical protein